MSSDLLLTRPLWMPEKSEVKEVYWKRFKCSESCPGHIVPCNRAHEIYISGLPVDLVQWVLAREQELSAHEALVNLHPQYEKKYIMKPRSPIETGGINGKGFGPRH